MVKCASYLPFRLGTPESHGDEVDVVCFLPLHAVRRDGLRQELVDAIRRLLLLLLLGVPGTDIFLHIIFRDKLNTLL